MGGEWQGEGLGFDSIRQRGREGWEEKETKDLRSASRAGSGFDWAGWGSGPVGVTFVNQTGPAGGGGMFGTASTSIEFVLV